MISVELSHYFMWRRRRYHFPGTLYSHLVVEAKLGHFALSPKPDEQYHAGIFHNGLATQYLDYRKNNVPPSERVNTVASIEADRGRLWG
jgi:hypothetical protein